MQVREKRLIANYPERPFVAVEPHKQLVLVEPDARPKVVVPSGEQSFKELTGLRGAKQKGSRMERHFMRALDQLMKRTDNLDPRDVEKLTSLAKAEELHGPLGDYGKNRPIEWAVAGANLTMALGLVFDIAQKVGTVEQAAIAFGTAAISWLIADLASGFPFHWSVDVLGSPKTPIVGKMIAEFQKHHVDPHDIAEGDFASVTFSTGAGVAIILGAVVSAMLAGWNPAIATEAFFATFSLGVLNAQNFHRWSHTPEEKTPAFIRWMQEHHLAVSREEHAKHHKAPHEGNYCLVNGIWNKLLDDSKIARWAERVAVKLSGGAVRPTTWLVGKNAAAIQAEAENMTFRDVLRNIQRSLGGGSAEAR